MAGDVATFIEHAAAEPVRLLGWSQGAAIAQETALLRPDLVAAAALIATYGRQNIMDRILQDAWRALDAAVLRKEERYYEGAWSKREQQIEKARASLAGMVSDLVRVGAELPSAALAELPALT